MRKLALALDGTVWAATSRGLLRLAGQHWQRVGEDWGYSSSRAQAVFVDRGGTLWVAGDDNIVFLPAGKNQFLPTGERVVEVDQIVQAPSGEIWIAEMTHSVRQIGIHEHKASPRLPEIIVGSAAILFDDTGSLWITTAGEGIGRLRFPEQMAGHGAMQFRSCVEVTEAAPQHHDRSSHGGCVSRRRKLFGVDSYYDERRACP